MTRPPVRVVLAVLGGSEGQAARAIELARALRDAGVEVVHAGELAGPRQVAAVAAQEDPDALGLFGVTDPGPVLAAVAGLPVFTVPEPGGPATGPALALHSADEVAEWLGAEDFPAARPAVDPAR